MAVDTANKRYSMIGFGSPVPQMTAVPDGTVESKDRFNLVYLFHGLDISAETASTIHYQPVSIKIGISL